MAAITSAANTASTEMELISRIVQAELLENTVIRSTVEDHSAKVMQGIKSIDLPRFEEDKNAGSGRFGGPEDQNPDGVTDVTLLTASLTTDTIALNKHKNLAWRIPDRVAEQSMVPVEAEYARKAGEEFAIYMDDEIRQVLATIPNVVNYDTASTMALADITEARKVLNKANVPQSERVLLISPDKEEDMLNIENFIHADKYGSREALLNGEIGQVFGFRVVISNLLGDDEAYAYHRSCVGYAMQQSIKFETQRADVTLQANDYSYSALWGCTLLYAGEKGVKFENTP